MGVNGSIALGFATESSNAAIRPLSSMFIPFAAHHRERCRQSVRSTSLNGIPGLFYVEGCLIVGKDRCCQACGSIPYPDLDFTYQVHGAIEPLSCCP